MKNARNMLIKSIIVLGFSGVVFFWIFHPLYSEVKIIRKAPIVNGNVVNAQWRPAPPPKAEKTKKVIINGKVELGATGGSSIEDKSIFNIYTDSSVSLTKPFNFASLNVSTSAYRKSYLQGSDDSYSVGLDLTSEVWSFGLNAKYDLSNKLEKDESLNEIQKNGNDLMLGVNASASFIQAFPISMSFSHEEKSLDENSLTTENVVENCMNLKGNGNFGDLTLDFGGILDNKDDIAKNMQTRQYGANVKAGYALNEMLNLNAYINPGYSVTSYTNTNTDINSTILDYGLGMLMNISENLQLTSDLGRVDNWTNSSSSNVNPIWKATAGLMYKPTDRVTLNSNYSMNKIVSGNFQNSINFDSIYNGDEGDFLRNAGVGGGLNYVSDNNGGEVSSGATWKSNVEIFPLINITVDANYNGGYSEKYDYSFAKITSLWNHDFGIELEHDVLENLKYSVGIKLNGYLPEYLANQIKQEYSTSIIYMPQIGWRSLTLNATESFGITKTGNSRDLSSSMGFGTSIPASKFIGTHYDFSWNWINLTTSSPTNNFSHTFGFIINGSKKPMSFGTDYTLQHGSGGIRHTLESNFYYPFTKDLGVRAWLSFSSFKEDGRKKNPFVIGVSSVYLF